jgi:hypothetical protein
MLLKRVRRALQCVQSAAALLIIAIMVPGMRAQQTGDVVEPLRARVLAGVVRLPEDSGFVPGARVEECDTSFDHVLSLAVTDKNGRFRLKPATHADVHYVKVSTALFKTMRYRVVLTEHGASELRLVIERSDAKD